MLLPSLLPTDFPLPVSVDGDDPMHRILLWQLILGALAIAAAALKPTPSRRDSSQFITAHDGQFFLNGKFVFPQSVFSAVPHFALQGRSVSLGLMHTGCPP